MAEPINERIALILKTSGLTQAEFGERIHISRSLAGSLCTGARQPSDRTAFFYALLLYSFQQVNFISIHLNCLS